MRSSAGPWWGSSRVGSRALWLRSSCLFPRLDSSRPSPDACEIYIIEFENRRVIAVTCGTAYAICVPDESIRAALKLRRRTIQRWSYGRMTNICALLTLRMRRLRAAGELYNRIKSELPPA